MPRRAMVPAGKEVGKVEEENAGKCWEESHDEVEMDGQLPPRYPYSEPQQDCLFCHGEDKKVLKKFYNQLDTDSENEISPTEAEKTQGPGKLTDPENEEPQDTEEQGLKGLH